MSSHSQSRGCEIQQMEPTWQGERVPGSNPGWTKVGLTVMSCCLSRCVPVHIWDSLWHAPCPTRKNDLYFVSQKMERVRFEPITNTTLLVSPATFSCHLALAAFLKVHFSSRTGLPKATKMIKYHFFEQCDTTVLVLQFIWWRGRQIIVGFGGQKVDNITIRLYLKVFKTNVSTYTALFKKWDCSFHQGVIIFF